ncbi:MAG TPA: hypothetical protein VHQ21_11955 [Rhodanobacteraceae bacterium]|nr:hypothetical protein [Rhodanobacteraceae bacterium]
MKHWCKNRAGEVVSLRDYFEAVLRERDKAITAALDQNEKRLAALNELRGDVATKTQLDALKERLDRMEGRSGGFKDGWGWIVGAAGVAFAAAKLWP